MPPTKKPWSTRALAWFNFAIVNLLIFTGCGQGNWSIYSASDRLAMQQATLNALSAADCATALSYSTTLYNSVYSNNTIRMLYASSQGCNIGIKLFTLINSLGSASFGSADAIFKTLVQYFPSKAATDTRLQSANYAQDALQSMLPPGTVVGSVDQTYGGSNNPGSVQYRDRTNDANIYLTFISMASVGTALNRYGYNAATSPKSLNYAPEIALTWTTTALIQADTSGEGCAIASGLLNMFDGIGVVSTVAPGSLGSSLAQINTNLEAGITAAAHANCDGVYGVTACNAALIRLRYRASCSETAANAACAAGIIQAINAEWI